MSGKLVLQGINKTREYSTDEIVGMFIKWLEKNCPEIPNTDYTISHYLEFISWKRQANRIRKKDFVIYYVPDKKELQKCMKPNKGGKKLNIKDIMFTKEEIALL